MFIGGIVALVLASCGDSGASVKPSPGGSSTPVPASTSTPTSTANVVTPTPSEPGVVAVIPGLSQSAAVASLSAKGFKCTAMPGDQSGWTLQDCVKSIAGGSQQETADLQGPGDQVVNMEADATGVEQVEAASFLAYAAACPNQGAQAAQAAQWVNSSIAGPDTVVSMSGLRFELVKGSAPLWRLLINKLT